MFVVLSDNETHKLSKIYHKIPDQFCPDLPVDKRERKCSESDSSRSDVKARTVFQHKAKTNTECRQKVSRQWNIITGIVFYCVQKNVKLLL